MEIIILDTDVVIEYLNNNENAVKQVNELNCRYAITVITRAEIIQGSKNKIHQNKLLKLIDNFIVIDTTIDTSQHFTYLFQKYFLSHNCSIPDMLNASICLAKDIKLLTLNSKDYRFITGLQLIKHNIKPLKLSWT